MCGRGPPDKFATRRTGARGLWADPGRAGPLRQPKIPESPSPQPVRGAALRNVVAFGPLCSNSTDSAQPRAADRHAPGNAGAHGIHAPGGMLGHPALRRVVCPCRRRLRLSCSADEATHAAVVLQEGREAGAFIITIAMWASR